MSNPKPNDLSPDDAAEMHEIMMEAEPMGGGNNFSSPARFIDKHNPGAAKPETLVGRNGSVGDRQR